MLRLNVFALALVFAQMFVVFAAPISQLALYKQVTTECNANQLMLEQDLATAQHSMDRVAAAFDTPAVQTVRAGISGAVRGLTTIARAAYAGQALDAAVGHDMLGSVARARDALDLLSGVPDAVTAAEITHVVYTLIDAVQLAGAVALTC